MRYLFFLIVFSLTSFLGYAQENVEYDVFEIPLHENKNAVSEEIHNNDPAFGLLINNISNSVLKAFIPRNNTPKAAVIICPGGGYHVLLFEREGTKVAEAFNKHNIAAFVLKYRLPGNTNSMAPLQDAQRAIQIIRKNSEKWGVNPDKIGIMGFSAGGHLAASLGVHYDSVLVENKEKTNLRPDFMVLVNPVISFTDSIGHLGSRENLLGKSSDENLVRFFSNELYVTENTPKTILLHTDDDQVVPVENSFYFYSELHRHKVPSELHVYSRGDHGFIQIPEFEEWFDRCIRWMKIEKIYN
ncbi:MAG: alpha/beta hydrolase [Petrimonas sp.]|mgnify:CR=1 FL=1|jgi:acetyl esterase/lipase